MTTVTGAINVVAPVRGARVLDPRDFGALFDGVNDDTDAIEAAIAQWSEHPTRYDVIRGFGTSRISRPIVLGRDGAYTRYVLQGGDSAFVARDFPSLGGWCWTWLDELSANALNLPMLIIQGARATAVRGITFGGANKAPFQLRQAGERWYRDATYSQWVSAGVRTNRFAPNCIVAIDPFARVALVDGIWKLVDRAIVYDPANRYPGLEEFYGGLAMAQPLPSSRVLFEDCSFSDAVYGVVIDPIGEGGPQNAENFEFNRCDFQQLRVGLAIGQSQSRSVALRSCGFGFDRVAISGASLGDAVAPDDPEQAVGQSPQTVINCQFGDCKYLFDVWLTSQTMYVAGLYAEAFESIGFIGRGAAGAYCGAHFDGCEFNFDTRARTGSVSADPQSNVQTWGMVKFTQCVFGLSAFDGSAGFIRFDNLGDGALELDSCAVFGGCINHIVQAGISRPGDAYGGLHVPHKIHSLDGSGVFQTDPVASGKLTEANAFGGNAVQIVAGASPDIGTIVADSTGLMVGDLLALNDANPLSSQWKVKYPSGADSPYYQMAPFARVAAIDSPGAGATVHLAFISAGTLFATPLKIKRQRWLTQ